LNNLNTSSINLTVAKTDFCFIDTNDWDGPLLQRPCFDVALASGSIVFLSCIPADLLFLCMWPTSLILRIIIEVRIGWKNLSALGKAATIVFALDASGFLQVLTPPPLPQTLFLIDRHRHGGVSSADAAWAIMSIFASGWTLGALFGLCYQFTMHFWYQLWLRSFDENWPEAGIDKVFERLLRRIKPSELADQVHDRETVWLEEVKMLKHMGFEKALLNLRTGPEMPHREGQSSEAATAGYNYKTRPTGVVGDDGSDPLFWLRDLLD